MQSSFSTVSHQPDKSLALAAATTKTYTRAEICAGPANGTGYFDPGSLHTAAMTGLQPSTKYYYVYGSDVRSFF